MTLLDTRLGEYTLSAGFTRTWLRLGIMLMYNDGRGFTLISRMGPAFFYVDKNDNE